MIYRYTILLFVLFSLNTFAANGSCDRSFDVFIAEQGNTHLLQNQNIQLRKGKLYRMGKEISQQEDIFTFGIRFDEGSMFDMQKKPLNTLELRVRVDGADAIVSNVYTTKNKEISIDGATLKNMNFDKNGNGLLLGLQVLVLDDCKLKLMGQLRAGKLQDLSIDTSDQYFIMRSPSVSF